ncbi:MAG TPA: hypothetical protein VKT82_30920 [Ktedonobacterales bacterium]|nr:hypothetical protein [Ktedonobacterales bacterium]
MIQKQPHQVVIMTPRGTVVVGRRLFDLLEARMEPNDLSLLREYGWWLQLSELVNGIQMVSLVPRAHA